MLIAIDNNDEINMNPPKKIINIIISDFELFFLLSIMAQLTQIPIFSSKPPPRRVLDRKLHNLALFLTPYYN